jgi:1,4-dihydroxy-2-naphthoate polyprenyltransferase
MSRPFFLLEGILLYLLGVGIASSTGSNVKMLNLILGQVLVTSIQLMVHYSNEYYDREGDQVVHKDRTLFSGGSGVLPAGILNPRVALRAALVCAGLGLAVLIFFLVQIPLLGVIGLLTVLVAWSYSAPPLRLVCTGWGELSASLIAALFVPYTGIVLQSGLKTIPVVFWVICLPHVLLHISTMVAIEFPDYVGDAACGKHNLPVRVGLVSAAWLHNGLIVTTFLIYGIFAFSGTLGNTWRFVFFVLPLAIWQMVRIVWQVRHPHARFLWLTIGAVGLIGLTGLLWILGLIT